MSFEISVWAWIIIANVYAANGKYGYAFLSSALAIMFLIWGVMEW